MDEYEVHVGKEDGLTQRGNGGFRLWMGGKVVFRLEGPF